VAAVGSCRLAASIWRWRPKAAAADVVVLTVDRRFRDRGLKGFPTVQPVLIILLQITLTADLEVDNFFANQAKKKRKIAIVCSLI
jgi:hypothetical protein